MHQIYIMPCLECNMLELLFATMMRNSGSDYESMLQYRLHFIRNQNGQGSSLAFLNPLQIHEGLRLTVKSSVFLVKGCLILEGAFTFVKKCSKSLSLNISTYLAIYLNFFLIKQDRYLFVEQKVKGYKVQILKRFMIGVQLFVLTMFS